MKVKFDGVEYEACSIEHTLALTNKIDALNVALDDEEKKKLAAEKAKDSTAAKCDKALDDLKELQAKYDAVTDPAKLDAAVAERVALIVDATKILGADFKFDGLTPEKIMTDAILSVKPDLKLDGRSAEYLRARFDGLVESGVRSDSIDAVPGIIAQVGTRINQREEQARLDEAEARKKLDAQNEPHWDAQKDVK
jgi:hypothetical protein